jgi:hypothetical protein
MRSFCAGPGIKVKKHTEGTIKEAVSCLYSVVDSVGAVFSDLPQAEAGNDYVCMLATN